MKPNKPTEPYGSWPSPITAQHLAVAGIGLSEPMYDEAGTIHWLEQRPTEKGRAVVVREEQPGDFADCVPGDVNVRSRVHEYGGGAWRLLDQSLFYSNDADRRVYQIMSGENAPNPITPEGGGMFADFEYDRERKRLIAVREVMDGSDAKNSIVAIAEGQEITELLSGHDFYSSPRISPDGSSLAWLSWDHPDMPWDNATLWVGEAGEDGSVQNIKKIAGGGGSSVCMPKWGPDGALYFSWDRTDWWNLYRVKPSGKIEQLMDEAMECGLPHWQFNMSTYDVLQNGDLICACTQNGLWSLYRLRPQTHKLIQIETPYTYLDAVHAHGNRVVFLAGNAQTPVAVVEMHETGEMRVVRSSCALDFDAVYLSKPESVTCCAEDGHEVHALFYPPVNPDVSKPEDELPPLVVGVHGGPTGSTSTQLDLRIQYYTSRGFAYLDVNYGGSTGYGRAYRNSLWGKWGILDVQDTCCAALSIAEQGRVDPKRMAIKGGSAGGFTVLAALTFADTFAAGSSRYGVSDCAALAKDTHKFEARYLDRLIAPWPDQKEIYDERSPISHVDGLSCPVIFFQGLEDKIVPPDQAERMYQALKKKGIPTAYVPFEGEQHGFRQSESIIRYAEAELFFFCSVFGIKPADEIESVSIENLRDHD